MARIVMPTLLVALMSTSALADASSHHGRRGPAAPPPAEMMLPDLAASITPVRSGFDSAPPLECSFSASAAASCTPGHAAAPSAATPPASPVQPRPSLAAPPSSLNPGQTYSSPPYSNGPIISPPPASGRLLKTVYAPPTVAATLLPLAVISRAPRNPPASADAPGDVSETASERVVAPPGALHPQPRHPMPGPLASATISSATPRNAVSTAPAGLTLETGMGRVIQLAGNTTSVFAADPKVAEVRPASANSLFVFGVGPGRTTIAAMDAGGQPIAQYDVTVLPSSYAAAAARGGIGRALPGRDIRIDTLGNSIGVNGQVGNAGDAEHAMQIARGFAPTGQTVTNRLGVRSSVQVNLRVRIVEMSRNLTRDLGVNWSALATIGKYATIGGATASTIANLTRPAFAPFNVQKGINGVIDALAQDQMVHMLAEPNLTALSGETASFLVGGEFPIPVAQQNNQTTIEFKQYGVSLAFVPTVMSDGHISLKVRPEVSQLSTQGAVQLSAGNSTIQVPALTVRRAETTVELGSGQSFAIAGLLQDNATIADTGLPFLGDIPILGALFRSDAFQRNETELVIIVTPYIVRPVSDPAALTDPAAGKKIPKDFDRLVMLRQVARPWDGDTIEPGERGARQSTPRPALNTGFIVQ